MLLCVGGGIAAYKSADLVRRLQEAGAEVQVAMTDGAQHFVGAATFQALSGRPVRTTLWDAQAEAAMGHIELARWATRVVVAPATADLIARLAHGLADDLVTTLCLATVAPIAVVPAMNNRMWLHPATQANVGLLRGRGVAVLGPDDGSQACGEFGPGRLMEPPAIVAALAQAATAGRDDPPLLSGRRVVVSAGPTYEDIDPVRYLGNRSSGKMGFALAAAAHAMGAEVVLVAGPVQLPTPAGVTRVDVRSAAQMRAAVLEAVGEGADLYVGAAAVADYAPTQGADHKLKKSSPTLTLELARTPDILAEVAQRAPRPRLVVGFAAETHDLAAYARGKLYAKQVDLIAANLVGGGDSAFEGEHNALHVFWPEGETEIARAPKPVVARRLLALLAERLGAAP
ncbi:bifunctional phosphopantothenoylcysteine decarboxylase/phosphopantothenate--cysteine ligase CoaBC [Coralloluteibacterium stylophorae]|uniref:Coenzyme A biosynthesis bifunctional protein CoaBC n=1 Tax=Coralloluteibacterium stylophorae TaxID=1776034 RepID=A0A8J8AYW7_9GAMM|nr:bifunctional phosphopantothenoylcysteine decarboxylase/phosphopantothenate--cysteine ligase CoaBC [Coralloluteibacterium stylophorae]